MAMQELTSFVRFLVRNTEGGLSSRIRSALDLSSRNGPGLSLVKVAQIYNKWTELEVRKDTFCYKPVIALAPLGSG